MTLEQKVAMAKAYQQMGFINIGIANNCLILEEQAYNRGVEYIEGRTD